MSALLIVFAGCAAPGTLRPEAPRPEPSGAQPVPGPPASGPPASEPPTSGPPAAEVPSQEALFRCFSWVHGAAASTDCYRSSARCEEARTALAEGSREVLPCRDAQRAWCTTLQRDGSERCFGANSVCERYRSFVQGNGLQTTGCVGAGASADPVEPG